MLYKHKPNLVKLSAFYCLIISCLPDSFICECVTACFFPLSSVECFYNLSDTMSPVFRRGYTSKIFTYTINKASICHTDKANTYKSQMRSISPWINVLPSQHAFILPILMRPPLSKLGNKTPRSRQGGDGAICLAGRPTGISTLPHPAGDGR